VHTLGADVMVRVGPLAILCCGPFPLAPDLWEVAPGQTPAPTLWLRVGAGCYPSADTSSSAQSALMNNLAALDDPALFIPYFTTTFSNYRKGFLSALRVEPSRAPPVHLLRPHIGADGQG